jgi:hypothetical protein
VQYFRVRSAVSSITGAIQSTTLSRYLRWLPLQHQFQQHRKYFPGRQRSGLQRHTRDDFYKCRRSRSFRLASGGPESKRYVAIQAQRGCPSDGWHDFEGGAIERQGCGFCAEHLQQIGAGLRRRTLHKIVGKLKRKEKMPGRFAEGPRSPGFILPASAVSEQENYGGSRTANLCCIQGL